MPRLVPCPLPPSRLCIPPCRSLPFATLPYGSSHALGCRPPSPLSGTAEPPALHGVGPRGRDPLEGKGPHRLPQKRVDKRLEEVAKAVGGNYCRLQMPLSLAFAVREAVAGRRHGALEGGGGGISSPLPMHPCLRGSTTP